MTLCFLILLIVLNYPTAGNTNPHNNKQLLLAGSVQLRLHRWPCRPDEVLVVIGSFFYFRSCPIICSNAALQNYYLFKSFIFCSLNSSKVSIPPSSNSFNFFNSSATLICSVFFVLPAAADIAFAINSV